MGMSPGRSESVSKISFYRGKKVLVTGGSGFIGSPLCRELVYRGAVVYSVSRSLPALRSEDVTCRPADLTDLKVTREVVSRAAPGFSFHPADLAAGAQEFGLANRCEEFRTVPELLRKVNPEGAFNDRRRMVHELLFQKYEGIGL